MDYDLVIIGSGIAGSAIAAVMSSAGYKVLALEQSTAFEDRVRGEWIAPWGVAETKRLGIYDVLQRAGVHELKRHVTYDKGVDWQELEKTPLPVAELLPEAGGPLTLRHPFHCQTLLDHAVQCGATVLRGVSDAGAELGKAPRVTYTHEGKETTVTCRLVVGAAGRTTNLRDQAGITLHQDKPHHMFAGMLVDGADDWPEDLQALGTGDDFSFLAFPQGGGRVRLYGSFHLNERQRFKGDAGQQNFLNSFNMPYLSPRLAAFAHARPAGPVLAYFNNDSWTDRPYADGLVLIGDAAGWNDPILGQGLSISYRDVRIVSDILKAVDDWTTPDLFAPYAEERSERMRRLRFACKISSTLEAEFGPQSAAVREGYRRRVAADQTLALTGITSVMGPETMPPEAFTEQNRNRILYGG